MWNVTCLWVAGAQFGTGDTNHDWRVLGYMLGFTAAAILSCVAITRRENGWGWLNILWVVIIDAVVVVFIFYPTRF